MSTYHNAFAVIAILYSASCGSAGMQECAVQPLAFSFDQWSAELQVPAGGKVAQTLTVPGNGNIILASGHVMMASGDLSTVSATFFKGSSSSNPEDGQSLGSSSLTSYAGNNPNSPVVTVFTPNITVSSGDKISIVFGTTSPSQFGTNQLGQFEGTVLAYDGNAWAAASDPNERLAITLNAPACQ